MRIFEITNVEIFKILMTWIKWIMKVELYWDYLLTELIVIYQYMVWKVNEFKFK